MLGTIARKDLVLWWLLVFPLSLAMEEEAAAGMWQLPQGHRLV